MEPRRAALAALALVAAATAACSGESRDPASMGPAGEPSSPAPGTSGAPPGDPTEGPEAGDSLAAPTDLAYRVARNRTREDSVYPNVGDPGVDALHYDLHLDWDPQQRHLDAQAAILFRATESRPDVRLDLGDPLEVESVTLDGVEVGHQHNGKDLVVDAAVARDSRHTLVVEYGGLPEPTAAPTTRPDIPATGWTVTAEGEVWTMQEPYGAFTWYPVNDQPADKAVYSFRITAPRDWVGVANGTLRSRDVVDGRTVTEWHMDAPASSYLVTIAIGDYTVVADRTDSGVPLTYWVPTGDARSLQRLRVTADAVEWAERRLGPFPFDSLGSVVVPSMSAMETQTMITYGDTSYTLSEQVIVHEVVHQWYGDVVSPTDWSDVWMNEGMTLYLAEGVWMARRNGLDIDAVVDDWAAVERHMRREAAPPGDYDPRRFGEGNIYYGPAVMWHELRRRIGDERFWAMVREWPTVHAHRGATREQYLAWVERETGEELTAFFDAWLEGRRSPRRPASGS